jgi:hypothetical protein
MLKIRIESTYAHKYITFFIAPIFVKLEANEYIAVDICLNECYPNTTGSA